MATVSFPLKLSTFQISASGLHPVEHPRYRLVFAEVVSQYRELILHDVLYCVVFDLHKFLFVCSQMNIATKHTLQVSAKPA